MRFNPDQSRIAAEWEAKLSAEGMPEEVGLDRAALRLQESTAEKESESSRANVTPIIERYWAMRQKTSNYGSHERAARQIAKENGLEEDVVLALIHEGEDKYRDVSKIVAEFTSAGQGDERRARAAVLKSYPDYDDAALDAIIEEYLGSA